VKESGIATNYGTRTQKLTMLEIILKDGTALYAKDMDLLTRPIGEAHEGIQIIVTLVIKSSMFLCKYRKRLTNKL